MRVKLIARIMAEGVRDIFSLLHATIRQRLGRPRRDSPVSAPPRMAGPPMSGPSISILLERDSGALCQCPSQAAEGKTKNSRTSWVDSPPPRRDIYGTMSTTSIQKVETLPLSL
jgi:hypothetical protein